MKVACPMSEEDYEALWHALGLFKNALTKKPETEASK